MMLGEGNHRHPTVHVPPWPVWEVPAAGIRYHLTLGGVGSSPREAAALAALQRFIPSSESDSEEQEQADAAVDAYSCDRFRIYEFKVRRCPRGRAHDWTECPFAHPGEKARRRDPRRFRYSSAACPDFRKGGCRKGDACELAHGVFECWLHPERYRTQPCKDGTACRRRVCFFAHTPEQLRVVLTPKSLLVSSPTSTLISPPMSPPYDSPPVSPSSVVVRRGSLPVGSSLDEVMAASLRKLDLSLKTPPASVSWGFQMGGGFGSPREVRLGEGFNTVPSLTEAADGHAGWPESGPEEEPAVPDVGWVSELVK